MSDPVDNSVMWDNVSEVVLTVLEAIMDIFGYIWDGAETLVDGLLAIPFGGGGWVMICVLLIATSVYYFAWYNGLVQR